MNKSAKRLYIEALVKAYAVAFALGVVAGFAIASLTGCITTARDNDATAQLQPGVTSIAEATRIMGKWHGKAPSKGEGSAGTIYVWRYAAAGARKMVQVETTLTFNDAGILTDWHTVRTPTQTSSR